MFVDQSRIVYYLKFAIPAAVVLWLVLGGGSGSGSGSNGGGLDHGRYAYLYRQFRSQKNIFVDDFLSHDVDGSFNGSSIAALCGSKTWTGGLVLTCEAVPGDLSDVADGILTCLRTAIEMGAEIVLPGIVRRSEIDLSIVVPHDVGPRRGVGLDYFFDREHLMRSLDTFCPQMKVHASMNAFYDSPEALEATTVDILKLPDIELVSVGGTSVLAQPARLGQRIHAYLDELSPRRDRSYPFHVHLRPMPTYIFPTTNTTSTTTTNTAGKTTTSTAVEVATAPPAELVHHLGRILRVRADLRRLAAAALFNLHTAFHLDVDPRQGLRADASYMAVELRTARDAKMAHFPSYAVQASDALSFVTAYSNASTSTSSSVVFLTGGAKSADAAAFADRARDFGLDVVTLPDLVEGDDATALGQLTWDQRGLVDYELAMRAGLFAGTARSSAAWHIALRRAYAYGDPASLNATRLSGTVRWHDPFSTLYGKSDQADALAQTVWP